MDSTRKVFATRLSGDEFTAEAALDALDRSDYADDDAYLDPEYQRARAAATAAYQRKQEATRRAEQETRYKELCNSTKLDSVELGNVDKKAREAAQLDLAAKRITFSDMGATIEKYAEKFQKEALRNKLSRIMMNETILAA